MAKQQETTSKPTVKPVEEAPTITSLGMCKAKKGYATYRIVSQGNRVLEYEVLTEPGASRMECENVLRVKVSREFLMPAEIE